MRKNHHLISKVTINSIRALYFQSNFNHRAAGRALHVSASTIANYVKQFKKMEELYPGKIRNNRFFLPSEIKLPPPPEKKILLIALLPALIKNDPHKRLLAVNLWREYRVSYPDGYSEAGFNYIYSRWRTANHISVFATSKVHILNDQERKILEAWRHHKIRRNWQMSVVITGSYEGKSPFELADRTNTSIVAVEDWIAAFKKDGIAGIARKDNYNKEEISAKVTERIDQLIKILHQNPSIFGINRTSWSLETLADTYIAEYKENMSRGTVHAYLKSRGFGFRKTREVLTSPDPNFREKLDKVIAIVSQLGTNDRFFSIDEMGPFAIKIKGGRSLMKLDNMKTIPAHPTPKGYLICTAALELSTNQVSHFYSPNKSTFEMIKLMELLLVEYKGMDKIYLSWDAASWHCSKLLKQRIKEINADEYRTIHHTPTVALAPLPVSSQFLNVIESVFAGLAKSVLHNSDYASIDECKSAIDQYFQARNDHFDKNPHRAGNKIWGKEIVKPVFYEANNCKDPNVRH